MRNNGHVDYTLGEVPKRLARRANLAITITMGGLTVVFMVAVLHLEGVRFAASTWLKLVSVVIAASTGMAWLIRSFSPDDRGVLRASQRRVLPPAEPPATLEPLRVLLQPGPIWQRRLDKKADGVPDGDLSLCLVADGGGLSVPNWLVERGGKRSPPNDRTVIPWDGVTRFRVLSDSDGPDLFEITVTTGEDSNELVRVRRREITDVIAVLDYVRAVGQVTIDLEASIAPVAGTGGNR